MIKKILSILVITILAMGSVGVNAQPILMNKHLIIDEGIAHYMGFDENNSWHDYNYSINRSLILQSPLANNIQSVEWVGNSDYIIYFNETLKMEIWR
jgi:hypothetical protein